MTWGVDRYGAARTREEETEALEAMAEEDRAKKADRVMQRVLELENIVEAGKLVLARITKDETDLVIARAQVEERISNLSDEAYFLREAIDMPKKVKP